MQTLARPFLTLAVVFAPLIAPAQTTSDLLGKDPWSLARDRYDPAFAKYPCERLGAPNWKSRDETLRFARFSCGGKQQIWLTQSVDDRHEQIVDVLALPALSKGEELRQECYGQQADNSTFAIGLLHQWVDGERGGYSLKKIRIAWRVNTTAKKFESIRVNGLKCDYAD